MPENVYGSEYFFKESDGYSLLTAASFFGSTSDIRCNSGRDSYAGIDTSDVYIPTTTRF